MSTQPRKWLPRQKYGAPLYICEALAIATAAGWQLGQHHFSAFAGLAIMALFIAALGWSMAAMLPDADELERVRKRFDKKIAKIQERRP